MKKIRDMPFPVWPGRRFGLSDAGRSKHCLEPHRLGKRSPARTGGSGKFNQKAASSGGVALGQQFHWI